MELAWLNGPKHDESFTKTRSWWKSWTHLGLSIQSPMEQLERPAPRGEFDHLPVKERRLLPAPNQKGDKGWRPVQIADRVWNRRARVSCEQYTRRSVQIPSKVSTAQHLDRVRCERDQLEGFPHDHVWVGGASHRPFYPSLGCWMGPNWRRSGRASCGTGMVQIYREPLSAIDGEHRAEE